MTRTVGLGSLALLLSAPLAAAVAVGPTEGDGVQAAQAWVKLLDDGQYGASWDRAAALFKAAISRADWEKKAASARAPLGKVLSRKLASSQLAHALPGAPDGTYVIVLYDTQFEHKAQARETVTVALDSGERFRGAGYFIH